MNLFTRGRLRDGTFGNPYRYVWPFSDRYCNLCQSDEGSQRETDALFNNLIRVAERFFSGVPQPPPPWRLLPESFFLSAWESPLPVSERLPMVPSELEPLNSTVTW